MGFWSTLANIGKIGGGIVGAPFTGGASLASLLPMGLDIAGSLARGKETGRENQNAAAFNEAQFRQQEAARKENALQGRAGLDLKRREQGRDFENQAFRNALLGAYGKNVQDVSMVRPKGIPTMSFTGGSRPSALGAEGRTAADAMYRKAMEHVLTGENYADLPGIESVAAPKYKGPGALENILGIAGAAGGTMNRVKAQQQAEQQSQFFRDLMSKMNGPQDGDMAGLPGTVVPISNPYA